jgi:hypothetical protein
MQALAYAPRIEMEGDTAVFSPSLPTSGRTNDCEVKKYDRFLQYKIHHPAFSMNAIEDFFQDQFYSIRW